MQAGPGREREILLGVLVQDVCRRENIKRYALR